MARQWQYQGAPWPFFDEEQLKAVQQVLESGKVNYWTGSEGREFEREFAEYIGVAHAIFVANGTVALELAIDALGLPAGAEVITTPRSFIASASAIAMAGLRPVFADIDPDSGNITPESIEAAITPATSAVLVVHLGGWPADMPAIRELCDRRNLSLIEDCSQAHGAMIDGVHVGSFADVGVWSFCQDKIITTGGEGGMVATNDSTLWRTVWEAKDHGKSWDAMYERNHPSGFRWVHDSLGTNGRGTEMQAALGRVQYRRLAEWRDARTRNAALLSQRLAEIPGLRVPLPVSAEVTHAYYRLYAYVEPAALAEGWTRDRVLEEVTERYKIPLTVGSCSEIYREKAFRDAGLGLDEPLPHARTSSLTSLAFLVHPGLTDRALNCVAEAMAEVMAEATGQVPGRIANPLAG